jgi:hypothetical protein
MKRHVCPTCKTPLSFDEFGLIEECCTIQSGYDE